MFTLLKIKLLLAVRAGSEGLDMMKSNQTFTQIEDWVGQIGTEDSENVATEVIKVLRSHVNIFYEAVDQANKHFWGALIDPGSCVQERSNTYAHGRKEEMVLVLKYSYDVWKETRGATEVIKAISQKKDH